MNAGDAEGRRPPKTMPVLKGTSPIRLREDQDQGLRGRPRSYDDGADKGELIHVWLCAHS